MMEGVCEQCGKTMLKTSRQQKYCPECKVIRNRLSVQKYYKEHAGDILIRKQQRREDKLKTYVLPPERAKHQADTTVWCRDYAEKQKAKTLAMIGSISQGR